VILAIIAVHAVLGVGGTMTRLIPTAHAVATVGVGLALMFFGKRPDRIVAVAAYGGMCDAYWRMTKSSAPWELSKYLLALGAVVLAVRFIRRYPKGRLPIALILVLVPGILLTAFSESLGETRDKVSMTEMGLIAFALAALAFRHLTATRAEAWNLGWILLGPLVMALAITTHALLTTPDLSFTSESSFTATGGFGPNQVSSAMGLITLLCVLLAFLPWGRKLWWVLAPLGLWATWATFLTFSRGGIYSAVLAGAAMLLVGITQRGARLRSLLTLAAVSVALLVVFSSANDFSGNWLDTRYEKAGTTGRTNIAEADFAVFESHPLFGVGSGRAGEFRRGEGDVLDSAAAHTEFTRLLAEHGVFGLAAIALIAVMLVQSYRWSLSYWNRLTIVALSMWSLTTMLHAATRIGAISVMLALTQLRVADNAETLTPGDPTPSPRAVGPLKGTSSS